MTSETQWVRFLVPHTVANDKATKYAEGQVVEFKPSTAEYYVNRGLAEECEAPAPPKPAKPEPPPVPPAPLKPETGTGTGKGDGGKADGPHADKDKDKK